MAHVWTQHSSLVGTRWSRQDIHTYREREGGRERDKQCIKHKLKQMYHLIFVIQRSNINARWE